MTYLTILGLALIGLLTLVNPSLASPINQAPQITHAIPDQITVEGQAFNFRLPDNTFQDPEDDPLVYTVTGLPTGLSWQADQIQGQPRDSHEWTCLSQLDQGTAGYYQITVTAEDPYGAKAQTHFRLQVLVAPFIVDIDTSLHTSRAYACRRVLPVGTYKLQVIGRQEGGRFDAWSRKRLWEHRYYVKPGLGRVDRTGRYGTPHQALGHRPPDQTLTLPVPTDVNFYLVDSINTQNNQGGVSLLVTQLVTQIPSSAS